MRDRDPVPPRSLIPATPRDLETICLKCLRKDPLKRYASAAELAEDLRRFQAHEPIHGRPVGPLERLSSWTRRNPVVAALLALSVAVVIGGFSGVTVAMFQAQDERDAKDKARLAEKDRADELEVALNRNRILLAYRAYRELDVDAANRELDACKPALRGVEWYALKQLCRGPRQVIAWRSADRVVLSGDGRRAAVAHFDRDPAPIAWVIDLRTNKVISTAPGGACAGALNTDGSRLAVVNDVGGLTVWDVDHSDTLWSRPESDFNGSLVAVAFLDRGTKVLTVAQGLRNGDPPTGLQFRQWEAGSGKPLATYEGPRRDAGTHVNLSRDGTRLAWMTSTATSYGNAVEVLICDTLTGKEVSILKGHAKRVNVTAFSPDNAWAATASDDGTVKVWDTTKAHEVATLNGTPRGVLALAFSPDGKTLAAAGRDRAVRLWDVQRGEPLAVLRGHADAVWSLAFLADGSGVASVGDDGRLLVWNLDPPGTRIFRNADDATHAGVFLPDGTLVSAQMQFAQNRFIGRLQFIDSDSRKTVREIEGCFLNLARSPDGHRLATFDNEGVRVWDAETGRALGDPLPLVGPIAFGPRGKEVIGVRRDAENTLAAVDAETGAERFRLQGSARIRSLAATPDGRRIVAGQNDGSVLILDAVTGKEVAAFRTAHLGGSVALAVRPDGEEVITAGPAERTAVVRDAATGKERLKLTGHTGTINAVAYSPDGRRILTGSEDHTVKLWDAATGQELVTFLDCTKPVRWVAFSADGRQLAAGGSASNGVPGSEVIVWSARPLDAPR